MRGTWRALLVPALLSGAVLRASGLTNLFPVLVDEAIYLRWAEIISHTHTWFISLLDAKPPLAYWIYAAMRLPFGRDPLLGARLISAGAGVALIWVLYRIGEICGGPQAGAIAAILYAVLPYAVFYDHIAYVDSLVNLCGALLVWSSLRAFLRPQLYWRATLTLGLTLGLALFVKTTVFLLGLAPLAIGFSQRKWPLRALASHLGAAFAVAAVFPLICRYAVPAGPAFDVNDVLFHHTNFFTPLDVLAHDPLANLRINGPLLLGYALHYLTWPLLVAAVAAAALGWRRNRLSVVILLSALPPLAVSMMALEYFPSRYAFPCVWPLVLVIACAAASFARGWQRAVALATVAVVFCAAAAQSVSLLRNPEVALHETDAEEFLGSGPYSGAGVLDAIACLRAESRLGPLTVLTDPWWGPPADAVFAYLNQVDGTRVYEAWWLQREGEYPLVPEGAMPIWRSQYQRVPAGEIDFSATPRLYYVTDTNYHTPAEVKKMSPTAHIVRRFPKHGGREFIDVYRVQ
jgi:4-amino-4-deoxy-L-arabinose transferase-like glycosyltransferase